MDETRLSLGRHDVIVRNGLRSIGRSAASASVVYAGLRLAAVAALVSGAGLASAVTPASMRAAPHAIKVESASVSDVLQSLARGFGLRVKTSGVVSGTVVGKQSAANAAALLDRLGGQHGFTWFVHAGVLYVSPAGQVVSERIVVGGAGIEAARSLVSSMQLLEERFGWAELSEDGAIHVSGPPDYVALVRAALRSMSEAAQTAEGRERAAERRSEVMVFRLRNANAEDRVVMFRGQSIVMPGLGTVLRNAVNGRSGSVAGSHTRPVIDAVLEESRAFDRSARQAPMMQPGAQPLGMTSTRLQSGRRVNIEADPRINAILVVDAPERRDYYERLIGDLDVPQRLVEIEALIVDIDRNLLKELGVEWTVSTARAGGTGALEVVSGLPSTTFVIPNIERFFARLRALDTTGQAAILGKPSVLTLDNQAAVIDLSSTEYIRLVGERAVDVKEVTAGTMLRVVPRVLAADPVDSVQLLIDIEDGFIEAGGRRDSPQVQRNTISTQALIDVGQSLVVGGYRGSQQRQEVNKVPVLGDLPVVGQLFRSTRSQDRNMERLFIITPRGVGPGPQFDSPGRVARRATGEAAERRIDAPMALEALFGGGEAGSPLTPR